MIKKSGWQIPIAVCSVILGIMLMVQFRTQQNYLQVNPARKLEDIAATLIQVNEASEQLAIEAGKLRDKLTQYKEGDNIRKIISSELEETRLHAGLVAVHGPGLVITLSDSEVPRERDEDFYYIHDWYLRDIVNLLWTGGADAVSINAERLIATTEIFCGGTTIFINNKLVSPPYIIQAIGDQVNLNTSLKMGTVIPILEDIKNTYGIGFTIETPEEVIIPGFTEWPVFRHVKTNLN